MFKTKCCGRLLVKGKEGIGEIVYFRGKISFLGDVNPKEGTLRDGRKIIKKILVVDGVGGSTVGAYILYALRYYNNEPLAIVVKEQADPIVVAGAVMANITLIDEFPCDVRDEEMAKVYDGCLEAIY